MPKFCANLTMLFNEADFLDRFQKAAAAGFKGVEYLFPYAFEKSRLADELAKHNLEQVLHNFPAGDWAAGERGIACIPGRETEFQEGVGKAIEYAKTLGCKQLNCLAGLTPSGVSADKVRRTFVDNLAFAVKELEKHDMTLLVEPLNNQDIPGFFLVHTADALDIMSEVGHPNLRLQYDVYHMQIMEGNLAKTIVGNLKQISHIQIADNPGRHEPGTGEINYSFLFKKIDDAGYTGWIGCEYKPLGTTEEGLGWFAPYR